MTSHMIHLNTLQRYKSSCKTNLIELTYS